MMSALNFLSEGRNTHFNVVDPVVCTNNVNSVVGAQVSSADGQMVHLEVLGKVKDDVKLGAVNEDDIVDSSVDG
jgi:hypothetical protein